MKPTSSPCVCICCPPPLTCRSCVITPGLWWATQTGPTFVKGSWVREVMREILNVVNASTLPVRLFMNVPSFYRFYCVSVEIQQCTSKHNLGGGSSLTLTLICPISELILVTLTLYRRVPRDVTNIPSHHLSAFIQDIHNWFLVVVECLVKKGWPCLNFRSHD